MLCSGVMCHANQLYYEEFYYLQIHLKIKRLLKNQNIEVHKGKKEK